MEKSNPLFPNETGTGAPEGQALDFSGLPEISGRIPGRRVSVNGAEIYFETFGEGPPLLLIHGGAATIESWFAQIPQLAQQYHVIVPEARGHGRTADTEGPFNFETMAADFAALLDLLGHTAVSVVGWSDGGVTGLRMAMDRPDLVSKVVAFGTHSRPQGMTEDFRQLIAASTPELFLPILVQRYKALSPDGPEHWPTVFGKLRNMWLNLPDFREEELQGIRCPVLLLVGESDIVLREETGRMAELIPQAEIHVLDGLSHYAPVEDPVAFNSAILGFLSK